jgi:hypothetical protein
MNRKIDELLKAAEAQKNSPEAGKSSVTRATREFGDEPQAENAFRKLREKLFDINRWETDSGVSAFQLFDENGNALEQARAETGFFVRIKLPGSGKADWVKIKEIRDAETEAIITVQPCFDPTEKDRETTSHFFESDATNNFCLGKDGAKLSFYVIGLNEKANVNESDGLLETVRNVAVAYTGWLGFQKIEWKTFCENFLNEE